MLKPNSKINIIPGFDTYTGDYHEIKRLMAMMGVEITLLADVSETFDSPNTGEYKLYPGGTPLPDAMDAVNPRFARCCSTSQRAARNAFAREVMSFAASNLLRANTLPRRSPMSLP